MICMREANTGGHVDIACDRDGWLHKRDPRCERDGDLKNHAAALSVDHRMIRAGAGIRR